MFVHRKSCKNSREVKPEKSKRPRGGGDSSSGVACAGGKLPGASVILRTRTEGAQALSKGREEPHGREMKESPEGNFVIHQAQSSRRHDLRGRGKSTSVEKSEPILKKQNYGAGRKLSSVSSAFRYSEGCDLSPKINVVGQEPST